MMPFKNALAFVRLFALLCLAILAGCASWKTPPSLQNAMQNVSSGPTQTHLTNKKRLVLEVEFVKLPIFSADNDTLADSWQRVDETRLVKELFASGMTDPMIG